MSVSAPVSYDLKVYGATHVGGVFFDERQARARAYEILGHYKTPSMRGEPSQVEVWRVEHKHWCGVTEIACTCGGVAETLVHQARPDNCPCWSGNEYGCPIHGPLAHLGKQGPAKPRAFTPAPRSRLSPLAERLSLA